MPDFGSALWNKPAAADSTPADPVTRSLRFGSGAYLSRTFGTPTDAKKKTISVWVKRSKLNDSNGQELISYQDSNAGGSWQFSGAGGGGSSVNDDFTINDRNATTGSADYQLRTKQLFRDPAAWYHIFIRFDTTDSTAADRCQIWVNGERVTDWNTGDLDYPDLNYVTTKIFAATTGNQYIGTSAWDTGGGFEGYMADFYFTDGTAYDVTDFAETDSTTGQWVPKTPTGLVYGNNGFHIDAQPSNSADLLVSSVGRNDGDTTFVDAAAGHTITKAGNTEHSIKVGNPFTGDDRAITFDGTSDMLEIASSSDFQFGTGDFTIEGWYNFRHLTGDQVICDLRPSNVSDSTRPSFSTSGAGLKMHFAGSNTTLASSGLVIGKWHHIEISRSSNTLYCFIDGTQTYSSTFSSDLNTDCTPHLGSTDTNNQVAFLDGYVFDYHILKGFGRHTSNFTVPTEKSTKDSTYTVLLLQSDKDDTGFDDLSDSGHTITATGSPTRTASTPFDAAAKSTAMYFDGSGDYLSVATSSDFDFGSGSYTYEGWFYFNGFSETPDGIFSRNNSSTQKWAVCTNSSGTLQFFESVNNSYNTSSFTFNTGQWYHIALCKNGTTYKVYVDGSEKISATLSSAPDANLPVIIGRFYDNYDGYYLDGYCFDFRAQKGVDTGGSKPSAPFELNPVYIGGDQSGNKNHFTPTNISSHDVMLDVPTKNYATWNPLDLQETASTAPTFAEGNLSLSTNTSGYGRVHSTFSIPSTGKWYAEFYSTSFDTIGVRRKVGGGWPSGSSTLAAVASSGSISNASGTSQSGLASWSSGDILGVEVDCDANTIQFLRNGSNYGSSESFTHYPEETFFSYTDGSSGTAYSAIANFGQDPTFAGNYTGTPESSEWAYSPSTEFKSLNSSNLDVPSVTPSENFNTVLYTGTRENSTSIGATSNPVDEMGFKPELLWIKDRDNASSNYGSGYYGNYLFDAVQGTGEAINIDGDTYTGSNDFSSNLDGYNGVSSFDSDGFTVDEAEAVNYAYDSDYNGSLDGYERYVAWGWKLGSNGSSSTWASGNTDPTTEKYNASAGVSVIRQEETSSNYPMTGVTVNHSLGAAPEFAFLIDVTSNTSDIFAWHKDLDANKYLRLNANSDQTTGSGYFPSGCSTATTFQIGGDIAGANGMDGYWDIYLYLFSGVEGYSKFGNYDPNGNVNGPFIYTGFRPAFVLTKRIDSSGQGWGLKDSARDTYNPADALLHPNSGGAEGTNEAIDLVSNGFKIRANNNTINSPTSSAKYIYAAFAESPLKYSNAR